MNDALFVISTGRCGTQWLAGALAAALGERAEVAHEPLHTDYAPREMLGTGDPSRLDPELAKPLLDHVRAIEETLATRRYIECGHPLWSTLPYLLRRFAGRARVVHLVRHPVPTALSWVTHSAYTPPLAPHLSGKVLLSPFDDGVHFAAYQARWPSLTPYEKTLFYWAEVNAFGLRLERSAGVPWLRVRFEDLLCGDALSRLLAFVDAATALAAPGDVVDEYRYVTRFWSDPRLIERHPEVLRVASELGYDPLAFDEGKLRCRYFAARRSVVNIRRPPPSLPWSEVSALIRCSTARAATRSASRRAAVSIASKSQPSTASAPTSASISATTSAVQAVLRPLF